MLINLSNHPYFSWSDDQKRAADVFGECIDMPFPQIDSHGDESYIRTLSNQYIGTIEGIADKKDIIVHIMGEMTFSFAVIAKLQQKGIRCIASTSERLVTETEPNQKEVTFCFSRFREYQIL